MSKKVISIDLLRGLASDYALGDLVTSHSEKEVSKVNRQATNAEGELFRYRTKFFKRNFFEYRLWVEMKSRMPIGIVPIMLASLARGGGAPEEYVLNKYNEGILLIDKLDLGESIWRLTFKLDDTEPKEGNNPFRYLEVSASTRKICKEAKPNYCVRRKISLGKVRFLPNEDNLQRMAEVIAQIPFTRRTVEGKELVGWRYFPKGLPRSSDAEPDTFPEPIDYKVVIRDLGAALGDELKVTASSYMVWFDRPEVGSVLYEPVFERLSRPGR